MNFRTVTFKVVQSYLHALNSFVPLAIAISLADDEIVATTSRTLAWMVLLTGLAVHGLPRMILLNGKKDLERGSNAFWIGLVFALLIWCLIAVLEQAGLGVLLSGAALVGFQSCFRLREALMVKSGRIGDLLVRDAIMLGVQTLGGAVIYFQRFGTTAIIALFAISNIIWLFQWDASLPFRRINRQDIAVLLKGMGFSAPIYTGWIFVNYAVIYATSIDARVGANIGILIAVTNMLMLGLGQIFAVGVSRYKDLGQHGAFHIQLLTGICVVLVWFAAGLGAFISEVLPIDQLFFFSSVWAAFACYVSLRCVMQYFSAYRMVIVGRSRYLLIATSLTAAMTPLSLWLLSPRSTTAVCYVLVGVAGIGLLIHYLISRFSLYEDHGRALE